MMAPADTRVILCFGDSITDGTASTMNGDDRWPNVLSRRLRAAGYRAVVLNAGIGGNQVAGPSDYSPQKPYAVVRRRWRAWSAMCSACPGSTPVIWLEGINDFSKNKELAKRRRTVLGAVEGSRRSGMRSRQPTGSRCSALRSVTALGSTNSGAWLARTDEKRRDLNQFISMRRFDGVVDFDSRHDRSGDGGLEAGEFVPGKHGPAGSGLRTTSCIRTAPAIWRWHAIDLDIGDGQVQGAAPRPR
jgi:lysophospholipase L1-like esterase